MKKITVLAALLLAFSMNAKAATIERSDDGNLTINVFASIIESFRVTIENADIVLAGVAPAATTILFDAASTSLTGLVDQSSHLLSFHGEAPFSGGSNYDDTIVVSVTKN